MKADNIFDFNSIDVYIAALPKDAPIGDVECEIRNGEISSALSEKVKRQKYFIWRLLYYALEHSFGLCGKNLNFVKESYGGWSAGDISVSLSHSENALAVAVSRTSVGIDIEHVHSTNVEKIAKRIMTAEELLEFECTPAEQKNERIIEIWTAKEAIFKSKKISTFIPKKIDTLSGSFRTNKIIICDEKYICSIATTTPEHIQIFTDIDLTKIKY